MNRAFWFLRGYWIVEITGAAPGWVLNRLTKMRIPFWNLQWMDDFTLQICVFPRDWKELEHQAELAQCQAKQVVETGLNYHLRGIKRRPVLLGFLLLTALVLWIVPKFLLFYEVQGNETVEEESILRALEELGIGFGTYGPSIKPRWIKDHVLNMLPQLQWITVTQNGCMAQVVVRERPETPTTLERRGYANVIATQSGMITKQSILAGQAVKEPGDMVLEGELLVSGLVDLERTYALEYAQAEIYARTWRQQLLVIPDTYYEKTECGETWTCIWLEIGKQRIKIFGNSGISTAACDKMINRKILSLPGGLKLPVSILVETFCTYDGTERAMDKQQAQTILMDYAERQALKQMLAGEILQYTSEMNQSAGCYWLDAVLECHEMIAETVEAKWNEEDFQDDGTNG